jgi:hypothetical protein
MVHFANNMSEPEVAALTGHASIKQLRNYLRANQCIADATPTPHDTSQYLRSLHATLNPWKEI